MVTAFPWRAEVAIERRSILIIEDDRDTRELYGEYLACFGFEAIGRPDGEQGLAAAALHKPDLILLDLRMPGVSGLEVARRLRADAATAGIPIVCVTGFASATASAVAAGCAKVLRKPFDPEELVEAVRSVLADALSPRR